MKDIINTKLNKNRASEETELSLKYCLGVLTPENPDVQEHWLDRRRASTQLGDLALTIDRQIKDPRLKRTYATPVLTALNNQMKDAINDNDQRVEQIVQEAAISASNWIRASRTGVQKDKDLAQVRGQAVSTIRELLTCHPSQDTRQLSACALQIIGESWCIEDLSHASNSDKSEAVRKEALYAMMRIANENKVDAQKVRRILQESMVNDESRSVRSCAKYCLDDLKG